jgi:hypothetical protein
MDETGWYAEILTAVQTGMGGLNPRVTGSTRRFPTSLCWAAVSGAAPINETRHDHRHCLVAGQLAAAHRRDELPSERVHPMAGKPHRRLGDRSRFMLSIVHASMMPRGARPSPRRPLFAARHFGKVHTLPGIEYMRENQT